MGEGMPLSVEDKATTFLSLLHSINVLVTVDSPPCCHSSLWHAVSLPQNVGLPLLSCVPQTNVTYIYGTLYRGAHRHTDCTCARSRQRLNPESAQSQPGCQKRGRTVPEAVFSVVSPVRSLGAVPFLDPTPVTALSQT